ncbi:MAG: hypothetical protein GF417_11690 [Candidatus Latescibacteria bacterium]|nr:hypothetical protein [bacterium]MBD3425087.1 hypothetical protein [Candidatus Latescibacterota bacterium]
MNDKTGKILAVTGAHANVGKTSLALRLVSILPGAVFVKVGHGEKKPDMDNIFYHTGTPFGRIVSENSAAPFLVIESNSVLKEVTPECVIYLPGEGRKKSSATLAEKKADLVRGRRTDLSTLRLLSEKLGLSQARVLEIIDAAGALPPVELNNGEDKNDTV